MDILLAIIGSAVLAALKLHISYVTARRWHGEFIKKVAYFFGFL